MPFLHRATEEVVLKLVYWGADASGKTSNLLWLAAHAPSEACGKLAQLATETESTQIFEFLPLTLGSVGGLRTQFHLYTVPGQSADRPSRQAILRGADGVVFVADARPERMAHNRESWAELQQAQQNDATLVAGLPLVLQLNWSEAPQALASAAIQQALPGAQPPVVAATATQGRGVVATLHAAARAALAASVQRQRLGLWQVAAT